jgi:hypothetical protein
MRMLPFIAGAIEGPIQVSVPHLCGRLGTWRKGTRRGQADRKQDGLYSHCDPFNKR